MHKELESLTEMEMKLGSSSSTVEDGNSSLPPKDPLTLKRAKTEALKKQVDIEKSRYFKSVQATKAMTLTNLKTRLPSVFKALMDFSRGSVEAIEAVFSQVKPEDSCDGESETPEN